LSELGNLENVVLGGKWIVLSIHGETNVWKGIKVLATGVNGDTSDKFVNEGFWSDEEGSSGVDDGLDVTGWDDGISLVNGVELECPVFLLNDLMGLNDGVVLGIHTWHNHVGLGWVGVEIEREGFIFKSNLIHESWEFINGDGVISETHDSAHLGSNERGSGSGGNFTELHGGFNISNSSDIFTSGTFDTSGSVSDVEILSILNIG